MGQTVRLGFGRANFKGCGATYACFKVTPPFVRVTAVNSGKQTRGGRTVINAGEFQDNGQLVNAEVEHDNGSIILLQSAWMAGARVLKNGALFLRLRAGAPLWEVIASVPTNAGNICGDSFSMFSGHADIMTLDELRLCNIDIHRSYVERNMDLEEVNECFRLVQHMRETVPRPAISAIATPTGIEMREVAQMPRRRMVIRRG